MNIHLGVKENQFFSSVYITSDILSIVWQGKQLGWKVWKSRLPEWQARKGKSGCQVTWKSRKRVAESERREPDWLLERTTEVN